MKLRATAKSLTVLYEFYPEIWGKVGRFIIGTFLARECCRL